MNDLKGWLQRADEDYRAIEVLRAASDPPWNAISFHAQQLAEKLFKAVLVSRNVNPPKTHNLQLLYSDVVALGVQLSDLSQECQSLYAPYATARYSPLQLQREEVEQLVKAAFRIRDLLLKVMGH
jgi:HEPN domain-containing protein